MKTKTGSFSRKFVFYPGKKALSAMPTAIDRIYRDSDDYERSLAALNGRIGELQEKLFAEKKSAILLVFQGMDTSGKDGAIKHVLSGVNPQGCRVSAFGRPSGKELSHDFLWRTNLELPERGHIGVFNRSYYEEVIVPKVHPEYLKAQSIPSWVLKSKGVSGLWKERYEDLRNHELYLTRQGIRVVKFFLHISKSEQRKRLLTRIDNPAKNWKFDPSDIEARRNWLKYQMAYEACFKSTSTPFAPWHIVPADDKFNARLIVARIVHENLQLICPTWPSTNPAIKKRLAQYRGLILRG